jgi:hypothetical protein
MPARPQAAVNAGTLEDAVISASWFMNSVRFWIEGGARLSKQADLPWRFHALALRCPWPQIINARKITHLPARMHPWRLADLPKRFYASPPR